jgi:NAD(P)-dependent dehydrogenase (short-subunit alcohol dehydrogenase family)
MTGQQKPGQGHPPAILITGAGSGIGRSCVLRFSRMGWTVFAGVRAPADARKLRAEAGPGIVPVLFDITDTAAVRRAVRQVQRALGSRGLQALVNNAGISNPGPLEFIPLDQLRHQFEVNVIGQVGVTQAFLPLLRRARGRIVNISSISGFVSFPFIGPYVGSKHALEAISDALRIEVRPWGLRVSIVEPGDIATPIWEKTKARAGTMLRQYPPRARKLYEPVFRMLDRIGLHGTSPDRVARAVWHAVTARHPRIRYLVGPDAILAVILRRFPAGLRDRILLLRLPEWKRWKGPA